MKRDYFVDDLDVMSNRMEDIYMFALKMIVMRQVQMIRDKISFSFAFGLDE